MMNQDAGCEMRRVEPIEGFPEALAAALPAGEPTDEEMVLLVDPITRRIISPWMPRSLADELRGIFARIAARGEAQAEEARAAASRMRRLVDDAAMVADDLRSLAYLFRLVDDDGPNSRLTSASHILVDCIETMAKRLDAIEASASALSAPVDPERR